MWTPSQPFSTISITKERKIMENYWLVSKKAMEFDDEFVFILSEIASFEIRAEVIDPSKPTTFSTSKQPWNPNRISEWMGTREKGIWWWWWWWWYLQPWGGYANSPRRGGGCSRWGVDLRLWSTRLCWCGLSRSTGIVPSRTRTRKRKRKKKREFE